MNTREPKGMPKAEVTVTADFRNYIAGDKLNIRFSGRSFIVEKINDTPVYLGTEVSASEVQEFTTGILQPKMAEPVLPATNKWTMTKLAVPNDNQDVLFVTISENPRKLCGKFYSVDSWCRLNMFCSMDGGFHSADRIAVWMPYPELPPHNI